MYDVIIGRTKSDRDKFGSKGCVFVGKSYVQMGRTTSLSNNVFLDVVRSHVILVAGKRGSGKSYSLGVVSEGIANLQKDIAENISVVIFDTMGIFWTMKYKNRKDHEILSEWGIEGEELDVDIYTPKGKYKNYKDRGIPSDYSFSIRPDELTAEDWNLTFGLDDSEAMAILIEKILYEFEEKGVKNYSIDDIISAIDKDDETSLEVRNAAKNRFTSVKSWGLFDVESIDISDITKGGKVSIIDVSCYASGEGGWNVKSLVVGLLSKKIFADRMDSRKEEEVKMISSGYSYFGSGEKQIQKPLVWLILDEAHEFLPKTGKTPATDSLVTILREGRQPGVSMILATQQPGEIHKDVMTQSDIVLAHRLTAKPDIDALNAMMQSYVSSKITTYVNNLPKEKGAAIVLDDNSERIYPIKVRPRITWHGGEAPSAIEYKKELDLGL